MNYDLAIVGGGIVGVCLALDAVSAGMRTVLIEAATTGCGASSAAMGHLVVLDSDADELALCRLGLRRWREYGELPGAQWSDAGTLWIAADESEIAPLRLRAERLAEVGIASEWLDDRALSEAEPGLRPDLVGALRVPGDALIYPPGGLRALLLRAMAAGLELRQGLSVRAIDDTALILVDGSRINAGQRVICCGLQSTSLLPGLPLSARKGQLAISDRSTAPPRHALVEAGYLATTHSGVGVACNIQPRPSGQLLVGSSREPGRSDRGIDPLLLGRMLTRAISFFPDLARLPILRCWTGLRPTTADGHPLIGAWPTIANSFVAAGHEGLGITTAPATAALLLDLLLQRAPQLPMQAYLPTRAIA